MKKMLLILGGLFLTFLLGAESLLTLDLRMLQAAGYDETENTWAYGGIGTADLVMKSTGNKNVKGELSLTYIPLDGLPAGHSYVSLDKASIKVQFPSLRLTMGKTRTGWGEGYVFNSGDVLYGSLSPTVDLTADEARSDTALLTLARVSLGRSYVEGIVMAAEADLSDPTDPDYGEAPEIWETSAGGRLVTEILGATVEAGYLCKGQEKTAGDEKGHRPYLSLHGYGWLDWYGSGSLAVPFSHPLWKENVRSTVNFSTGLFRQFGLGYDGSLGVRLEALLFPWQEWEEQAGGLEEGNSYALYLYPELTFGIGQNLTLPLMAIVSPLDLSAEITAGASWQVYQGFSFLGYIIGEAGDASDTFESGNVSFMAGMRYKY